MKALIFGISGQDGTYLSKFLLIASEVSNSEISKSILPNISLSDNSFCLNPCHRDFTLFAKYGSFRSLDHQKGTNQKSSGQ